MSKGAISSFQGTCKQNVGIASTSFNSIQSEYSETCCLATDTQSDRSRIQFWISFSLPRITKPVSRISLGSFVGRMMFVFSFCCSHSLLNRFLRFYVLIFVAISRLASANLINDLFSFARFLRQPPSSLCVFTKGICTKKNREFIKK